MFDGTDCDCAFIKTTIPVESGAVFNLPDLTNTGLNYAGRYIRMSGKNSGIEGGFIIDSSVDVTRTGGIIVLYMAESTYGSQGGDSGGTVSSDIGNKLLGFHTSHNSSVSHYTKHINVKDNFTGLTFGF